MARLCWWQHHTACYSEYLMFEYFNREQLDIGKGSFGNLRSSRSSWRALNRMQNAMMPGTRRYKHSTKTMYHTCTIPYSIKCLIPRSYTKSSNSSKSQATTQCTAADSTRMYSMCDVVVVQHVSKMATSGKEETARTADNQGPQEQHGAWPPPRHIS